MIKYASVAFFQYLYSINMLGFSEINFSKQIFSTVKQQNTEVLYNVQEARTTSRMVTGSIPDGVI